MQRIRLFGLLAFVLPLAGCVIAAETGPVYGYGYGPARPYYVPAPAYRPPVFYAPAPAYRPYYGRPSYGRGFYGGPYARGGPRWGGPPGWGPRGRGHDRRW